MKIIDGKNLSMGRVASYAAKQALQGEEIIIINCNKIFISGTKASIKDDFEASKRRHGSSLKGPIVARTSEKIVKRTIRGMIPDHREGRGRIAFKKIKCYVGVPKEFEGKKTVSVGREMLGKGILVEELVKQ